MGDKLLAKLRYMGKQYAAGQVSRGGKAEPHYLEEAADTIDQLRTENAQLKARITELEAQLKGREGWQPIETAPEATHVFVWLPNYGTVRGIYTLDQGRQRWWNGEEVIYPTHWMPLPAAPKCKRCEGRGIVPIGDGYSVNPCPDCAATKGE